MIQKQPTISGGTKHGNRSAGGDFFISKPAQLYLADGTVIRGQAPAWQTDIYTGEVVFNTGMTGYVESLTDPSYAGQILVFTYPLIGNYGVQISSAESSKIQVSGVVVSEAAEHWSHSLSDRSLIEWLHSQNIPIITNVDTRSLTKHLRTIGTMVGSIASSPVKPKDMKVEPTFISVKEPIVYNETSTKKVIVVDCGAKENIIRSLAELPVQIKRVPYDYDYTLENYDGVLLSNGPGDPTDYTSTIAIAKKALKIGKPIFGICLGNQLLGLAAGACTYKLKFGHRGHNQPCIETSSQHGVITSQNHGYAIEESSLPRGWRVSYRNLNDNSVEGITHTSKPFSSVQFHPEASPGPTDTAGLFERFYGSL